jgi:hypothetical protein
MWFYGLMHLEEEHEEVEDHAADHVVFGARHRDQVDEDET